MKNVSGILASVFVALTGLAAPINTGSLISEMIDLHRLPNFPSPLYKTIQFSSYDHRSAVPGGKDWFANSDGFGGEPVPNFEAVLTEPNGDRPGEYLICDVTGPGAIVRLWTAQIEGTVRVFLDGNSTPLYDGSAQEFFLHPYDAFLAGTDLKPEMLTGAFYQRNAAYTPMPFAKRCKIIWVGNHKKTHFYQIQIRKYADDAEVTTFSSADLKTYEDSIRRVAATAANVDTAWTYRSSKAPVPFNVTIKPHERVDALTLTDGGAIEKFLLKLDAPKTDEALRQTILHIRCDGSPWGQVQSPVGDFFGTGPGINPYASIPFTVAPDGTMTCRYVMPYKDTLVFSFENLGDQPVTIAGSALPVEKVWDDASSMYFCAHWRVNYGLVGSKSETMGAQDLPFLIARGRGVYVGTAVMLLNPNNVPTSWGNWWGEGDEKVFIDGDVRPSTFGTGSEDYFNYAWSASDLFAFPFCGQTRNDGPANRGFVSDYRWHIVDPLPFANNLAFYMELFTHERTPGFSYARLSYYYARPGAVDDILPITSDDVRMPQLPPAWEPQARFGAAKWEFHACEKLVRKHLSTKVEKGNLWEGGRVLVWNPARTGQKLTLTFRVAEAGEYSLNLACMLCPDGGAFDAVIDGKALKFDGKDLTNLTVPYHIMSSVVGAGAGPLKPGKHQLTLTAQSSGKSIGLDFLALRKK